MASALPRQHHGVLLLPAPPHRANLSLLVPTAAMTSPSPSPSYGSSLPDSVLPLINPRCTTHLYLLPSLSSFLVSLTSLQRQTSDSLSKQVGQFRRQISASAGERSGGMEQQSTLEGVLAGVLEQVDLQVREQGECATRVGREVAEEAEKVGARLEGVRKKVRRFAVLFSPPCNLR